MLPVGLTSWWISIENPLDARWELLMLLEVARNSREEGEASAFDFALTSPDFFLSGSIQTSCALLHHLLPQQQHRQYPVEKKKYACGAVLGF